MPEAVEEFARAYMAAQKDAWELGDFAGLRSLERADVKFSNINGTVFAGRDAHFAAIEGMKSSFGNAAMKQEWQYLMGSGTVFSLSYEWSVQTPGEPLTIAGILVGRIENDQLVEEWGANYSVDR